MVGYAGSPVNVSVPDTVTHGGHEFAVVSVGDKAFYGCTAITDVYCHADPAVLTWGDASKDFMSDKQTKIHVELSENDKLVIFSNH